MNLAQLRYLSDLQHTGSISKTAKRNFLSQQTLSNNIKQMEEELKVTLLVRTPTGVILTEEAEELIALSDSFLTQYDKLVDKISLRQHSTSESLPKRLKIYTSSVLAGAIFPSATALFAKKFPKIRVSIKEVTYQDIFPAIIHNECNLAFLSINEEYFLKQLNIYDATMFHYYIILTDRLVACVSSKSPLAKKELIEQSDFTSRFFTYLNIEPVNGHSARKTSVLYTANNIDFHDRILRETDAISLMPRHVYLKLFDNKHFISKPLEGARQVIYHSVLYAESEPHPVMKEFASIVTSML